MSDPLFLDTFQRLMLALGIGFLVGIERGWQHRDAPDGSRAAGLRTHALIGLLGGVSGALLPVIGQVGFASMTLAFAGAFIWFKVRESERDHDLSVTGAIAGLLVFALSVYAMVGEPVIAGAVGVTLVALLAFKQALHGWLDRVTWKELRSALLILAATAIALPLLPDRTIDPWGLINPRELWFLTILLASASFAGYVAVRVLGADVGLMAGASVGALVSSTVVTAELGRRVRYKEMETSAAAAAASLAATISLGRTVALLGVTASSIVTEAGPALCVAAALFSAAAFAFRLLSRSAVRREGVEALHNPLDLAAVAQFALVLGTIIIVGRIVTQIFGQAGFLSFAATAGLADIDAVTLAAASLVRRGLDPGVAAHAVLIAAGMNTLAKGFIAYVTGGWRYAGLYLAAGMIATAAAAATWTLATRWLMPIFSDGASLAPL